MTRTLTALNALATIILAFFSTLNINAQYCLAVGPSTNADSNIESVIINGESGSAINYNGCPGISGLNDLTSTESVDLLQGNSYTLTVQFGTCGGNYNGAGEVWIDFDQNDIFDPSESIGTWTGTPPTAASVYNFTVPGAIPNGQTRMRIVQQEGGSNPIDPCVNFTWGSTTDFLVSFGPPIDCSSYVGDDMSDPRDVSAIPFAETHDNDFCYSNISEVYASPDVFYRIIPSQLGITEFNVSLCNSMFDTYLEVLDVDTNVIIHNDDYGPCAPQSELSFSSGNHDTLFIVVQGWSNEQGTYTIEINDGEFNSIEEMQSQILIYPNPSEDFITISGIKSKCEISIRSLKGDLLYTALITDNSKIDLSSIEAGVYFIELKEDNLINNQKLVIK